MMGRKQTLVALAGALLLASTSAAQPPVSKFVPPVKGQADVEITAPQGRWEGNIYVTRIRVKNVSKAPIAGFKVDQYFYNKNGDPNPVTGAPTFRHPKPFQPGEILEVVLRVPRHPDMGGSQTLFAHANGTIKPTRVDKFKP